MVLPLAIWTTGEPVAAARAARGDFFQMIAAAIGDYPAEVLDVRSQEQPLYPDPTTVSGIIVSGSPARLMDQEAWMLATQEALLAAMTVGVPILGICFGHQLLGEALGGTVEPNPRGREIGTVDLVKVADDPLFDPILAQPHVAMTHLDSVTVLPPGARVLSSSALEPYAAVRFRPNVWSVQYHPEMDAEIIGHYLEARRPQVEAEGRDVDELLGARRDSPYGRQLLARFTAFCAWGTF